MLGKFEFYWFFHGLMISEKNINKNNIKWFIRSCSLICRSSVCTKKTCVLAETCCVLLVFIFPDLVWCWYNKTNIPRFFCLISKLFALGNINYLSWIISNTKQKGMEYLLIIYDFLIMLNTNYLEMHKQVKNDEDGWVASISCTRCDQWYHCEYISVTFREASSLKFFIVNKVNQLF